MLRSLDKAAPFFVPLGLDFRSRVCYYVQARLVPGRYALRPSGCPWARSEVGSKDPASFFARLCPFCRKLSPGLSPWQPPGKPYGRKGFGPSLLSGNCQPLSGDPLLCLIFGRRKNAQRLAPPGECSRRSRQARDRCNSHIPPPNATKPLLFCCVQKAQNNTGQCVALLNPSAVPFAMHLRRTAAGSCSLATKQWFCVVRLVLPPLRSLMHLP